MAVVTPDEIAHTARGVLAKYPDVRVALLFGSQARGTARDNSDIDIALVGGGDDTLKIGGELGASLKRDIDIVSLENPPIPLLENIARDGQVIYERSSGNGAMWRSRTLAMLEIDLPWFDRMADAWLPHVAKRGVTNG